jgi:hypothetical protein
VPFWDSNVIATRVLMTRLAQNIGKCSVFLTESDAAGDVFRSA